jgi:hypothetical protein
MSLLFSILVVVMSKFDFGWLASELFYLEAISRMLCCASVDGLRWMSSNGHLVL